MKIRLKKDLLYFEAGTVFRQVREDIWKLDTNPDEITPKWLNQLMESEHTDTVWFERIDETPLYWEPEFGKDYFCIEQGEVICHEHIDDSVDYREFDIGNAFPTQEAAQAHVEYLKALTRVRKYIQERRFETVNVSEQVGVEITTNSYEQPVPETTRRKQNPVLPKLKFNNDAEQVIDNCHDDLKTIFGVES